MIMKTCFRCQKEKKEYEFSKNQTRCKECDKEIYEISKIKKCLHCGIEFRKRNKKHCSYKCMILNKTLKINDCWEWQGSKNRNKYGQIRYENKSGMMLVHRLSYLIFKGEIPNGMFVCHSCDNKSCCNPDHLWLGTPHDNNQDCLNKNRHYKGKQGCESHKSKFKKEQILSIRKRIENGETAKKIANEFRVQQHTILAIKNKKTYKNI